MLERPIKFYDHVGGHSGLVDEGSESSDGWSHDGVRGGGKVRLQLDHTPENEPGQAFIGTWVMSRM